MGNDMPGDAQYTPPTDHAAAACENMTVGNAYFADAFPDRRAALNSCSARQGCNRKPSADGDKIVAPHQHHDNDRSNGK